MAKVSKFSVFDIGIRLPEKYQSAAELLPENGMNGCRLELENCLPAFANSFRRVLFDELEFYVLTFDEYETTSQYFVDDDFRERLGLVPILQNPEIRGSLDVHNKDQDFMSVRSGDIKFTIGGKAVEPHKVCNTGFVLATLRRGKRLSIKEISVSRGNGHQNAKYCPIFNYHYMPTAVKDSRTTTPDKFAIEFCVNSQNSARAILVRGAEFMVQKLSHIKETVDQAKDQTLITETITITTIGKEYSILFKFEKETVQALLTAYIYKIDPSIDFLSSAIPHPQKLESTLRLVASKPHLLVSKALELCISDYQTVLKKISE